MERHGDGRAGTRVGQPQPEQVAGAELEVLHRLGADQHGVGSGGQPAQQLLGVPPLK